jgi:hypothetical protein
MSRADLMRGRARLADGAERIRSALVATAMSADTRKTPQPPKPRFSLAGLTIDKHLSASQPFFLKQRPELARFNNSPECPWRQDLTVINLT